MLPDLLKKLFWVLTACLIQFGLLGQLGIAQYLDIFALTLFVLVLTRQNRFIYFLAFLSGLLFDLFTGYPLGTKSFIYLFFVFALAFFCNNILRHINFFVLLPIVFVGFSTIELINLAILALLGLEGRVGLISVIRILTNALASLLILSLLRKKWSK